MSYLKEIKNTLAERGIPHENHIGSFNTSYVTHKGGEFYNGGDDGPRGDKLRFQTFAVIFAQDETHKAMKLLVKSFMGAISHYKKPYRKNIQILWRLQPTITSEKDHERGITFNKLRARFIIFDKSKGIAIQPRNIVPEGANPISISVDKKYTQEYVEDLA